MKLYKFIDKLEEIKSKYGNLESVITGIMISSQYNHVVTGFNYSDIRKCIMINTEKTYNFHATGLCICRMLEKLNELAEKYGDVECEFGELNWPIDDKDFILAMVYKAKDKHNDEDRVYLYASRNYCNGKRLI